MLTYIHSNNKRKKDRKFHNRKHVKVENKNKKHTKFLKSSILNEWRTLNKNKKVEEQHATRKIMYGKTKKKKIFVLFHVQNEKFREKNTQMLFYFQKNFPFNFSELIVNFNFHSSHDIHFLNGYIS